MKWFDNKPALKLLCIALSCVAVSLQAASLEKSAALDRIVSADGSLTEIVYALGQESRLVGVDTTSGYPLVAKKLPQIGYKRNISAEGVLSLSPQILIVTADSGPDKILQQIEAAGVVVKRYSANPSLDVVREKILGVAKLLAVEEQGVNLWKKVQSQVLQARSKLKHISHPAKIMFVLSAKSGSPLISGTGTMADAIIKLAGGMNAAQGFSGYKPMSIESIIAAAPDAILMMSRSGNHSGAADILLQAGFKVTPAAANKRLIVMDGMLLLGFGPRIGEAVERLITEFYPHLSVDDSELNAFSVNSND
ncbi:MAG: hemin-binding periplasmic protein [Osedax symbiont Rs1]|nr:MAG: hemin-binding periplasmic protein [Osedax symbiont Rs1]